MAAVSVLSHKRRKQPPDKQSRSRELQALRTFLMAHRDVALTTDDVALILSLREDRDWFGIERPGPLKSALASGDPAAFFSDLSEREGSDSEAALTRAVRLVREDCRSAWYTGAINGLNAIAPSIEAGADTEALRDAARDVLIRVKPEQFATLSVEAIRFVCAEPNNDPRLQAATDVAAWTLRKTDPPLNPAAPIELLRRASDFIADSQLMDIRQNLSRRPFSDLTPLLVPGEHVQQLLVGPVIEREYDILRIWDATEPDRNDVIHDCLDRLIKYKELGVSSSASLSEVTKKVTGSVSVADPTWASRYEKLLILLADEPPSEITDALGTAWAKWPQETSDGLLLAMRLNLGDAAAAEVNDAVRTGLLTAAMDQVTAFVHRARELGLGGPNVDGPIAGRWADTGDDALAELVADGGGDALKLLVERLASVAVRARSSYGDRLRSVTNLVVSRQDAAPAEALVRHLASVIHGIGRLDEITQALLELRRRGADISSAMSELDEAVGRANESDLGELAMVARNCGVWGIDPEGRLARTLLARSKALAKMDWATAEWLARNPKVTRATKAEALAEVIARGTDDIVVVIANELPKFAGPLRGDSRVTEAVLPKLATQAAEAVLHMLPRLKRWKAPKRPGRAFVEAVEAVERMSPGICGRLGRTDLVASAVNARTSGR
jgi:hypothetical protein